MDRHRARPCPPGGDPGGRRLPAALLLAALVVVALVTTSAPSGAATGPGGAAAPAAVLATPSLTLLSQTGWVTVGGTFDLHIRASTPVPPASLGVEVSVYPCLSTLSGFDQSLTDSDLGEPMSATRSAIPLASLPTVSGGGYDLAMPVVEGDQGPAATASAPFTVQLLPVSEQCQSFPAGVFPVRVQLVDTGNSAVVGSFTSHLVTTDAPADTQHLRVAVVLPVQVTMSASRNPSAADLLARPSAALAPPSTAALAAVEGTVATIAVQHPTVPVTLQVSGQTAALLDTPAHQTTVNQLGELADSPSTHQLTAAPFTPVDATGLVDSGLTGELGLQVARGTEAVATTTGRPAPSASASASTGLGAWITGDGVDGATVTALADDGFRQIVLPSSQLSAIPTNGSTTAPFTLDGNRGVEMEAMAADDDLTSRFTSDPGDPVLAAHQLVAELAQLYYERPNGLTPRAVMAVAPSTWNDEPAFVDALLGSLNGNPIVEAETTSQLFSLFPTPATCRSGCRPTPTGTSTPPVGAVKAQRARVNAFSLAAPGAHSVAVQLGDLVLAGEAEGLRGSQQSAVLANAGAALDAQLSQVAVESGQSVTLTARSGHIPVTIVSDAPYPIAGTLVVSSDKLLFVNGLTQWSTARTLLPHRSNVFYVPVQARSSGGFRMDVTFRAPGSPLRLATGEVSVRSTSTSVVGVVLTVGAVVVLAVWWIRTSLRRRAARRAEEEGGDTPSGGPDDVPTPVGAASGDSPAAAP